jgi:hypothetical protein
VAFFPGPYKMIAVIEVCGPALERFVHRIGV